VPINVWTVTAAAAVTCLATGLGAVPFLFLRGGIRRQWLGTSNAIASGFMLAASAGLLWQGWSLGVGRLAVGGLAGAVFIHVFRKLLGDSEGAEFGRLTGADARRALVVVAVMTAHSASEGIGVGVPYGQSEKLGLLITLAIAIHNAPEGLAISLVLVPRGATVGSAAWWSVFSSLPRR
jgi:zinc transporter ZupT